MIKGKLTYDKDFLKKIEKTVDKAKATGMQSAAQIEIQETRKRIETTKVDPTGKPWAPWAPRTRKLRAKTGGSLLFVTGKLSRSFYSVVTFKNAIIKSAVKYFRYLQEGTPKMPARPMLGWSEKTISTVLKNVKDTFK